MFDYNPPHAGIAQLVEQLLRKQLVGGSNPLSGTKFMAFAYGENMNTISHTITSPAAATYVCASRRSKDA